MEYVNWRSACLHANISEQIETPKVSTRARYGVEYEKPIKRRKWALYSDSVIVFGSIKANKKDDEEAAVADLAPLKGADRQALFGIVEKLAHKVSCNKRGDCILSCCQLLALRVWRCVARLLIFGRRREQAASAKILQRRMPLTVDDLRKLLELIKRFGQSTQMEADRFVQMRNKHHVFKPNGRLVALLPITAATMHQSMLTPGFQSMAEDEILGELDAPSLIDGTRAGYGSSGAAHLTVYARRLANLDDFRRLTYERAFTALLVAGEPQSERATRADNERTPKIEKLATQLAALRCKTKKWQVLKSCRPLANA